jgi:hypothetical protein
LSAIEPAVLPAGRGLRARPLCRGPAAEGSRTFIHSLKIAELRACGRSPRSDKAIGQAINRLAEVVTINVCDPRHEVTRGRADARRASARFISGSTT